MSKRNNGYLLTTLLFLLFSTGVIAAVEPKNVVVFFLPAQKLEEITSAQEAVQTVLPKGAPDGMNFQNVAEKDPYQEKYGISTSLGVSLYDKGGVPLDEAVKNVVSPAKVLIFPPEESLNKKGKLFGLISPESVSPVQLRIFPITHPKEEIEKEAKVRPVVKYKRLEPPGDNRKGRPANQEFWTVWVLGELEKCNMDAQTVLPTLYWMSVNKKLTDDKNICDMKKAVIGHLKKCHPWPAVYYTPVNNDVPVRAPVQMAAEYLETDFEKDACPAMDLTGINFERTDFIQGNLKNADFSNSYLHEATFDHVDLSNAVFKGALMDNVLFQDVSMPYASFEKARMKYTHFHRTDAKAAKFDSADLQDAQFRDVTLSFSSFSNAVLQNTAWQDVRAYRISAPEADFTKSEFDNVILNQMHAEKAVFEKVTCKNCVLKSSVLENAYFYKAVFEKTSFDQANLSYSDFDSAVFGQDVSFKNVSLYKAKFSVADLKLLADLSIEKFMQVKPDKHTQISQELEDKDPESYDTDLDEKKFSLTDQVNRYTCSKRICEDRLLGRVSNQNLAVRAMTILSDQNESLDNQVWALCTMGCIARKDKKLEASQIDVLTAFVKRNRRWDAQTDLFRPYTPLPPQVQMALYILTDPSVKRDLGHDIDLSGTDLRTADLSRADLRNVDLSASHLGGTNLRGSKTDLTMKRFDQAVVDEYTRFPKRMGAFKAFELPDTIVPPWWKPARVRVFKDGSHLWTVTTEKIPFSDDFILDSQKDAEN